MMANGKLQKQALLPPRSPFPTAAAPYADHGLITRPQGALPHRHAGHGHGHHRALASESFIEEQPSWLDDLLKRACRDNGLRHLIGPSWTPRSSAAISFACSIGRLLLVLVLRCLVALMALIATGGQYAQRSRVRPKLHIILQRAREKSPGIAGSTSVATTPVAVICIKKGEVQLECVNNHGSDLYSLRLCT
ncbi:hypothetical protein PR202_ga24459 [Eleusine coracana subsp. coracana]|uniref:Uncharacterized protein n=1 Tax=Eleusine coracana subsp. coracana TaxID=191504 RepID=A0AAV5D6Z4_ELECO|nr:hypothetical protein PR202_ga24459 [Eleusine coracana subsp. coracana]